jgi:predicted dehydrogenase
MKLKATIGIVFLAINMLLAQPAPVRMGIIGMTHDHVNAILQHPNHQGMLLVGFAEPNKEMALAKLRRAKLPDSLWYSTIEELLAKTKPTAVCDFRSTYQHLATVQICAPKGIHVMVEKPLAVSLSHARQIQALAQKHNIQVVTNYETTWYASHAQAYTMLQNNKDLGPIRKMVVMDGHNGPVEIGCTKEFLAWLTDPKLNGAGALMDFGCYGANLMTWLMKGQKPSSVMAITQTLKPHIYPNVDDEANVLVKYPNATGIIQASWNWPIGRKDTEIYTENAYIVANSNPKTKVRLRGQAEQIQEAKPLVFPFNDPFSYFAAVASGQHNPTGDLGSLPINMTVVEILEAAKISAKTKKEVFFPLK